MYNQTPKLLNQASQTPNTLDCLVFSIILWVLILKLLQSGGDFMRLDKDTGISGSRIIKELKGISLHFELHSI